MDGGKVDKDWMDGSIDMGPCGAMRVGVYRPANPLRPAPLVLHLHGGAFQGGCLDDGHFVSRLLADAGAVVLSADYPTGTSFAGTLKPLFAALQSLETGRARWADRKSKLFVAGEEAGGNLAAALALMARDLQAPKLAGQILFSPMLDPDMATCSIRNAAAGEAGCKWAEGWHSYLGTAGALPHPYAAPAGVTRLAGVAPALVLTAEDCPMHDESLRYAERLAASGIAVDCHCVATPTAWPDALSHPITAAPGWRAAIRDSVADFFAKTSGR